MISLSLLVFSFISVQSFIIFPISNNSKLLPVSTSDFDCSLTYPHTVTTGLQTKQFEVMIPSVETYYQDGFMIQKQTWASKCSENFFGSQTISFSITGAKINPHEAISAFEDWGNNRLSTPYRPIPPCSWMNENMNSKVFFIITPHKVRIDHYDMHFKDSLFLNGKCKNYLCFTHFEHQMWISNDNLNPHCPTAKLDFIKIHYNIKSETVFDDFIESNYIPVQRLNNICRGFHYCNQTYFLTSYGHAFMFKDTNNSCFPICNKFNIVQTCSAERELVIEKTTNHIEILTEISEYSRYQRCIDTVEKIKKNQSITRRDLGFLSPISPGTGYGFKITNQGIMKSLVTYYPIEFYSMTCFIGNAICSLSIYNQRDNKIMFDLPCTPIYELNNTKQSCEWFNGIILKENEIIYSDEGLLMEDFYHLYQQSHNLNYEEHISNEDLNLIQLSNETDFPSVNTKNFFDIVGNKFSTFFDTKIWTYIGLIVGFVLGTWLLSKLIKCCHSTIQKSDSKPTRKSRQKDEDEHYISIL